MNYRVSSTNGWKSDLYSETLEDAQGEADSMIGDCSSDISIDAGDENHPVCKRRHYGVPFDPEMSESNPSDIIDFGEIGYLGPWDEMESPVIIADDVNRLTSVRPFFKDPEAVRHQDLACDIGYAKSGKTTMLITWGLNAKEIDFEPDEAYVTTEDGTVYEKLVQIIETED